MARDHAALMDGVYRRQRHIYDATRKFFLFGRDGLIEDLRPAAGDRVLEVGCGTGRNLVLAARRWPQARFFGFDISEAMLETARESVARAGLEGRIRLAQGDATGFDPAAMFGEPAFDRVAFSYTLSMIPDWRGALRAGFAVVAPGGLAMAVDFGDQAGYPALARRGLRGWLGLFHVAPRDDIAAAWAEAAQAAGLTDPKARSLYSGYAVALTAERPAG
ncbi:class I SAM-dependent methyltransferase [Rubrimonas cliftonensis]|uniref:S-adenosylmethionine-diacylgycerolhomoserine-N-methlytransferase n=1 Tax=Rubrimonas cliftonensis TaxID=89524 RepID=A0A1H4B4D0_9RHOB|nr:class I SAM-dependent methyltransferase [Rubrimonas cliftonensis]SEA42916.1 S-adenosylmethionine-diacylgycerolhomoserine-N-methlytransferase [Rubrimonas cliftonensis]